MCSEMFRCVHIISLAAVRLVSDETADEYVYLLLIFSKDIVYCMCWVHSRNGYIGFKEEF